MKSFIENKFFAGFLDQCWSESQGYLDAGKPINNGEKLHLLVYHTYRALSGGERLAEHLKRSEILAHQLSQRVLPDGLLQDSDGGETDHPAHGSSVADALGTFTFYGKKIGAGSEVVLEARNALLRIADFHPRIRPPGGLVGRTQQLRFETRVFYWAWRVTEKESYKKFFLELMENGIHAYQHPVAIEGGLVQPSLHPDFTWNYTCTSGTTTEYATNTHTPVYYTTEPQGFVFVYLHGLKDGVLPQNPKWDVFCQKFFHGLLRNLSRAGHTMSDVDGYGIHRAWYSSCLVESMPLEGAAAEKLGLEPVVVGWFRWYLDRYIDFVKRNPAFEKTGLPETIPFGQNLTIEKQFPALGASRLYAMIARALVEYRVEETTAIAPPAMMSYAWWHNWVRVSTPNYETSFVGTTSLCRIPVARHFGDPHLGCMHGGSPLSNLFSGEELLYATSNDPAGLWHVELQDTEGSVHRSIASSFEDETSLSLLTSQGELLNADHFENYQKPHNVAIEKNPAVVQWAKHLRSAGIRFFTHLRFEEKQFASTWGFHTLQGHSLKKAFFNLAVPADLSPEWLNDKNHWQALKAGLKEKSWPKAIRWKRGKKSVAVEILPTGFAGDWTCEEIPVEPGRPGGENSFSPYRILQVRLTAKVVVSLERMAVETRFRFEDC